MLSWNISGLKAQSKKCLLWERIMKEEPDILLLQETKCVGDEAAQILTKCWKQAKIVEVDEKGTTGGLAILWNPATIRMEGFFTSKWTITTSFKIISSNKLGYVSNIYGLASPGDKESFFHHFEWISDHIGNQR
jgi:exonuclease III